MSEASRAGEAPGLVGRIYRNMALLVTGKAMAGLISLLYLAIAARILGPAGYGMLVLVHGYTVVVGGIVNFPGWHAVVRFGAPALAQGDQVRLRTLMRFTARLELAAGAIAVAIAALAAPLIGPHLGLDAEAQHFAVPYSLAVLAAVRTTPLGLLQLMRQFRLLAAHTIVNPVIRLLGTLIVAWCGLGLRGFLVAWLCAALIECASMWIMGWWCLRRYFPGGQRLARGLSARRDHDGLMRFMLLANVDISFAELAPRIGLLTVGWVLGPQSAGLYSVAQRATVLISQPAILLGQASYAELAHCVRAGATGAALHAALRRCVAIALGCSAPVLVILYLFPQMIVRGLAGPAFAAAAAIILAMAIAQAIRLAAPPISATLIALGRPSRSVAANVLAGVGLLPVLILFLHRFGLAGAGYHAMIEAAVAVMLLGSLLVFQDRQQAVRSGEAGDGGR